MPRAKPVRKNAGCGALAASLVCPWSTGDTVVTEGTNPHLFDRSALEYDKARFRTLCRSIPAALQASKRRWRLVLLGFAVEPFTQSVDTALEAFGVGSSKWSIGSDPRVVGPKIVPNA